MKKMLLFLVLLSSIAIQVVAQSRTVTGRVSNDKGEPIIGATVKVKDGALSAQTDENGNYTIEVPGDAAVLVVEDAITGAVQEVTVGTQTQVDVFINSKQQIGEVEIYGRKINKATTVGSAGLVTAEQISQRPVTSISKAIEGQVAGIQTTSGGGQPGSNSQLNVRGPGSLSASGSPLIVVDGAVYPAGMETINPNDVESLNVLKDATATSLYGARGANGVILITTKRGKKSDKPRINFDGQSGFINRMIPEYDRIGTKDYYETAWDEMFQTFVNQSGGWSTITDEGLSSARRLASQYVVTQLGNYNSYNVPNDQLIDPNTGKLNPNAQLLYEDDWQEGLLRTGQRHNYNISISNGDDKSDYYLSVGYLNEQGIVKQSNYDRLTTRLNVNSKINRWLAAGISLSGTYDNQRGFVTQSTAYINPFFSTRLMGPIYPLYRYDSTGALMYNPDGTPVYDFGDNPGTNNPAKLPQNRVFGQNTNAVAALYLDDRSNSSLTGVGNGYVEATILKDFKAKVNLNTTYITGSSNNFQNSVYGDASNVKGRFNRTFASTYNYTFNQQLSWTPKFGIFAEDKHHLQAIVMHENVFNKYEGANFTRIGYATDAFREAAAAALTESSTSAVDYLTFESYLGQLAYDYQSKYIFTASLRRDGVSRFGPKNRWGNFWAVGGAYRITEEPFMSGTKNWLDELKIKASYGTTGNEAIGDMYAYTARYAWGYSNNIQPGYVFNTWGNPNLKWESNFNFNTGVDFSVFKQRVYGTLEFFIRGSDDLLFVRPLAPSTGISAIQENIGSMRNRGVEATIDANILRGSKAGAFRWNTHLVLTHFKNKITSQSQEKIAAGTNILQVGGSIYDFWMPKSAGVDPSNGDELWYIKFDEQGNAVPEGTTTNNYILANRSNNRQYLGTAVPDLYGAITNTFDYKNFQLSFMVSFGLGGKYFDAVYQQLMHANYQGFGSAWHTDILKRWQKPGDVTDVPRVDYSNNDIGGQSSDRFLVNNSYASIKNIYLAYEIPAKWISGAGFQRLSVYAQADNVWIFAARKGMDPQQNFAGTSDFVYYPYRTIMFGVKLGL